MPATSILGGIAQETSQQELLAHATLLLAAILEKMPRSDVNDRMVVNTSDQGNVTVALAAAQTLATCTTVSTVTAVNTVSNQTNVGGRDASHAAYAWANMGTAHIYSQITVS